jgi:DnaA regulatory inactivator Hda
MTGPPAGARQLPLDLGHRPALGQDDFLVAASNADAVGWIDKWPLWGAHALALHGPPGCGKTHLVHVWQAASGACRVEAAGLRAGHVDGLALAGAAVVVEDADQGGGVDEIALLHLFNLLKEQDGTLLLTGRQPPGRWKIELPDLRSRLAAVPVAAIRSPDDALLQAVVVKMFHDRQLQVDPDVVTYLLPRMERSFEAARQLVERIDRQALVEQRRITIPLVKGMVD